MHGLDFVVTSVFFAWLMVWIFHCVQQMKDINGLDVRVKTLEKLLEEYRVLTNTNEVENESVRAIGTREEDGN